MKHVVYDETNSVREVNAGPRLPIPLGWREVELPDDHADIVAFRAALAVPLPPPPLDDARATVKALIKKGIVTRAEIDAEK
jgi:hypothetical protein